MNQFSPYMYRYVPTSLIYKAMKYNIPYKDRTIKQICKDIDNKKQENPNSSDTTDHNTINWNKMNNGQLYNYVRYRLGIRVNRNNRQTMLSVIKNNKAPNEFNIQNPNNNPTSTIKPKSTPSPQSESKSDIQPNPKPNSDINFRTIPLGELYNFVRFELGYKVNRKDRRTMLDIIKQHCL